MNSSVTYTFADVWREVSSWPREQRLEFATRVLRELEESAATATVPANQSEALRKLVGIWKCIPAPTDEEISSLVEQETMKKHG